MYRILLAATRVCLFAFLVGGGVVVAGQTLGIIVGSGQLVTAFGTDIADNVCVIAGIAGIFAFLLLYTPEGKENVPDAEE
ncbi:hypothetical protein [Amycolatopsis sp. BJA-103]|uniref:hypothetical protein n=1 Tax=Amycolatopsis sp. BJA-103 TaxID=1911175 RepID=UPI000C76956F|nr:hypothetical protein [Amycolatopsis sp. BJA-103]AUI64387.1 hypothetical protein BKN51_12020 [Amycolatopsis sp. BJA-103]PNE17880.1 hypothetical protein B1H26_22545 [Amycolatopsis sp. BJA-103]